MKILILGNKGALGQALAKLYAGDELYGYDRAELDITNEAALAEAMDRTEPELVFNCAAYNDLDKAEAQKDLAMEVNGYAVGKIARASKKAGATVIHFSTNYVFDGLNPGGYDESAQPNPSSAYAESKYLGERELQSNAEKFYLVRTSWLYGGQALAGGKKSFIEIMLEAAGANPSLNLVDDEFGHPTLISDLAQAIRQLAHGGLPFGIYHITNSGYTNWYGWAKEIFRLKNITVPVSAVPGEQFKRAAKRPKFGILLNTKLPALRSWQEALADYLETGAAANH